jgi:DNA invertase Pin-like site-specific DNA recombinase
MTVPPRAALYLRVSTARQAEHDVSIPDQKRQGEAYCEARGYQLVETYVEPGASATNDRRPEFQRMIEAGTSKPAPFDVVIVHSFSRFFRDHFELEFYVRKLAKNGVKLVSITQEIGDDPMHVMMRQSMALFDEYQSKENAKHVIRALKENARQGFWNGSLPPIGYRVVAAEQRGAKVKKKLKIDPLHAETVRLIYRLALHGDGAKGQMGVKNIVSHLNRNRIFTRDGGRWGIGQVNRILTRRTYMGEHEFNKRAKSKELKPVSEIVVVPVPPLIDRETFEAVQALLKARHPTVTPSAALRRHQRPDDAHRPDPLRQVRRGHDHSHRQGRALSLLRLFDESPAGADSLRRYCGARWTSWTILSPAISKTVCSSPTGWKRSSRQCSTGGRSDPSASMSTLAN